MNTEVEIDLSRPPVDTTNKFLVGVDMGNKIRILKPPMLPLSREDALNLAAWIVCLTFDREGFKRVLDAVEGT